MNSVQSSFKYSIEYYPFNRFLIIKDTQSNDILKINTKTYRLIENSNEPLALSHNFKIAVKIDAIYGKIKLNTSDYLIVVDKSKFVGRITNKKIYQVISTQFIKISDDTTMEDNSETSTDDNKLNDRLIVMMKEHLNSGYIYYSDNYCLTGNLQSQIGKDPNYGNHDPAFFINSIFADKFIALAGNSYSFVTGFIPEALTRVVMLVILWKQKLF